jgi:hypothetical protein
MDRARARSNDSLELALGTRRPTSRASFSGNGRPLDADMTHVRGWAGGRARCLLGDRAVLRSAICLTLWRTPLSQTEAVDALRGRLRTTVAAQHFRDSGDRVHDQAGLYQMDTVAHPEQRRIRCRREASRRSGSPARSLPMSRRPGDGCWPDDHQAPRDGLEAAARSRRPHGAAGQPGLSRQPGAYPLSYTTSAMPIALAVWNPV